MEQEIIIYLAVFFIGASVTCSLSLLFLRSKLSWRWQSFFIVIGSISLAMGLAFIYEAIYNIFAGSSSPKHLFEEALSNTYRNKIILGFAIFGGCLAIWARIANQRQLKYTQEQLENSAEINRNDRFAKAVELLNNKDSTIAMRGGLSILRDLVRETPKAEYIRCVEIISHWLIEDAEKLQEHGNGTIRDNLLDIAVGIFRTKIDAELQEEIKSHKNKNEWTCWPILKGANLIFVDLKGAHLQGSNLGYTDVFDAEEEIVKTNVTNLQLANLENANLQDAKLEKANLGQANLKNTILENADLTDADMSDAKDLTKEQILSAKWFIGIYNEPPPKLPDYLMKDPEVQEWLSKPTPDKTKKPKN